MSKNTFHKSYDAALLSFSVLRRLGSGKLDSFNERLRCQKIHYFAQLFRVAPSYTYGLYLRGPYSSTLTHDLFTLTESGIQYKEFEFVSQEMEGRFQSLKKYIAGKSTRQLELASTLHWFLRNAKLPSTEAEARLKELKTATDEEVKKAQEDIKGL